jgi:hypothetical protein
MIRVGMETNKVRGLNSGMYKMIFSLPFVTETWIECKYTDCTREKYRHANIVWN